MAIGSVGQDAVVLGSPRKLAQARIDSPSSDKQKEAFASSDAAVRSKPNNSISQPKSTAELRGIYQRIADSTLSESDKKRNLARVVSYAQQYYGAEPKPTDASKAANANTDTAKVDADLVKSKPGGSPDSKNANKIDSQPSSPSRDANASGKQLSTDQLRQLYSRVDNAKIDEVDKKALFNRIVSYGREFYSAPQGQNENSDKSSGISAKVDRQV